MASRNSTARRLMAFAAGPLAAIALMVGTATAQKLAIGTPLVAHGYVVPVTSGLIGGLLISWLWLRQRSVLERLEAQERALREVLDAVPDALVVTDVDGRIVDLNAGAPLLYGRTADELLGMRLDALTEPTSGRIRLDETTEVGEARLVVCRGEDRIPVWRRGRRRRSPSGEHLGGLVHDRDLTELEAQYHGALRLLHAIDQVEEGVVITDLSGAIVHCNPAFSMLVGLDRAEIQRRGRELIPELLGPLCYAEVELAVGRHRSWSGPVEDEGGRQRRVTVSPIQGADGATSGTVALVRDVTRERQLEVENLRLQRFEATTQLATGLARDFGALVNAARAQLADVEGLDDVRRSWERAGLLVRQLEAFARRRTVSARPVDLNEVLSDLGPILQGVAGDARLALSPSQHPCRVSADPAQLEEVFVNLIANARDAVRVGGSIAVRLDRAHDPALGDVVVLEVADDGAGMDPHTLAHAFEPYFTTKGGGTGLGLAAVYGLARQHGGELRVDSEPGAGTVVRVLLPRLQDTPDEEPSAVVRGVARVVLVAEDNPVVRKVAARVLERAGFVVVLAPDGLRAIEILDSDDHFDLVFSDVMMPGATGLEVWEYAQTRRPRLPFLFASGYYAEAVGEDLPQRTRTEVLAKPYDSSGLLRAVERTLAAELG